MGTVGPLIREQIRARDGEACWFCSGKLNFAANASEKRKPTIEHLEPTSLGGNDGLDNLRLCHPGCNKHLGNRPRAVKERMREKRQLAVVKNKVKVAKTAPASASSTAKSIVPAPKPARPDPVGRGPVVPLPAVAAAQATLVAWKRLALVSTGAALFLAGLALGQFIA